MIGEPAAMWRTRGSKTHLHFELPVGEIPIHFCPLLTSPLEAN